MLHFREICPSQEALPYPGGAVYSRVTSHKSAKAAVAPIDNKSCRPSASRFGDIGWGAVDVADIQGAAGESQVATPVVEAVPVDMVDLFASFGVQNEPVHPNPLSAYDRPSVDDSPAVVCDPVVRGYEQRVVGIDYGDMLSSSTKQGHESGTSNRHDLVEFFSWHHQNIPWRHNGRNID